MNDQAVRKRLNQLPVAELIRVQREHGRRRLPDEFKTRWQAAHRRAVDLLRDDGRGRPVRATAALLRETTYALHMMTQSEPVTYYSYTDVGVIDWYIGSPHAPIRELKERTLRGAFALFHDLARFESDSLSGFEERHKEAFDADAVRARQEAIRRAVTECDGALAKVGLPGLGRPLPIPPHDTLEGYAVEPARLGALVHLTCFPRTTCHDEVVFLRTIHIGELCFFALRVVFAEAVENLRRGRPSETVAGLKQGTAVTALLWHTFQVLTTMPVPHFFGFREYTERGSAIQSRNYQLLDIHYRGVDSRKLEVYRQNRSLEDLRRFRHPSFVSLRAALRDPGVQQLAGADWLRVEAAARQLDRELLKWRGLHLQFAKNYLGQPESEDTAPTAATGGTSGYPYLNQYLREGLFAYSAEDQAALEESVPGLTEYLSQRPIHGPGGVAPPTLLRGIGSAEAEETWSPPSQPAPESPDRVAGAAPDGVTPAPAEPTP